MLASMTAPERPQDEGEAPLRLLLVEDDVKLGRLTATYLESHKLAVTWVQDGEAGLDEALRHTYDVMLLDLMLPKMDGIEVCRRVRAQSDLPIVMLTARDEEADRVMGLELGADDYVTKPYSSRELLARVRALVRRRRGQAGPRARALEVGQLRLEPGSMQATLRGEPLHLTTHEFKLLYALAERAGGLAALAAGLGPTRTRHRAALQDTKAALVRALATAEPELAAEDLRVAATALGRITGRIDVEELLDVVFRDFCIGK